MLEAEKMGNGVERRGEEEKISAPKLVPRISTSALAFSFLPSSFLSFLPSFTPPSLSYSHYVCVCVC